ncbi:hypothetical protein [Sphingobacterium griseoflavum]|uniref:Uncharacterized protein n=1 Tax=Sphingobacterium griseoflavum TaxID=1474952 RepID=A0ABQ3HWD3_9SPHI|nr:hypothetical protein [Sphingobacterium griseoflavum]GHE30993.1 hypothetical protein GCM10017764_12530 [Sphingobacterium griseoflavum]
MMQFVRLNYKVLRELKSKGYNALRSCSDAHSVDPSWVPDEIHIDFRSYAYVKTEVNQFLVIENVLQHVAEVDLSGMVFLER